MTFPGTGGGGGGQAEQDDKDVDMADALPPAHASQQTVTAAAALAGATRIVDGDLETLPESAC